MTLDAIKDICARTSWAGCDQDGIDIWERYHFLMQTSWREHKHLYPDINNYDRVFFDCINWRAVFKEYLD